jgi:hypothetical protein
VPSAEKSPRKKPQTASFGAVKILSGTVFSPALSSFKPSLWKNSVMNLL